MKAIKTTGDDLFGCQDRLTKKIDVEGLISEFIALISVSLYIEMIFKNMISIFLRNVLIMLAYQLIDLSCEFHNLLRLKYGIIKKLNKM